MKKIIVEKPGGYLSLVIKDSSQPNPKDNECLVEIRFIGVNYADIIVREGYYTAAKGLYPLVPGFEYSGTVTQVGSKVTRFKVGDQVCGITRFGGYVTAIAALESSIRHVPNEWSLAEAAGLLVPHLTAFHALFNVAHVKPGERVLVHSAAGGVGSALIQQSKAHGCIVHGVVGSQKKQSAAESLGADHVVVKSKDLWQKLDELAPEGFDAIFDANGLTTPRPGYERLRLGGRLIVYGFAELFPRGKRPWLPMLAYRALRVPKFRIRKMTSTNRTIAGFNIAFLFDRVDLSDPALDRIIEMANNKLIKRPNIKLFPFKNVSESHKYLESGLSVGRVILEV